MIYGVGFEVVNRQTRAWVEDPVFWPGEEGADWTSLALLKTGSTEKLLLATDGQPHSIDLEGRETSTPPLLESSVSEMRVWTPPGAAAPWAGVCLALTNQVLFVENDVFFKIEPKWLEGTAVRLGSSLGQGPGELAFPLSFDAGPDGRIFVLDAGNGRIQVFDGEAHYITQWGHPGSGAGEFNFGRGGSPEDFAGSVAVDSEGHIYVADVGNRRIQKFAP